MAKIDIVKFICSIRRRFGENKYISTCLDSCLKDQGLRYIDKPEGGVLIRYMKEGKPIKVPKFKVGDFIQFNGMGHTRYTIKEVCGLSHYINSFDRRMDMAYTDNNFELVEQKPAEWSEDDQSNFCELRSFIFETYRIEDASRLITWLKSLKERIQPDKGWIPIKESFYANNVVLAQKKDKSDAWEGYTVIADHTLDPLVFERYINIENISTQSLWKSSEKQIKVCKEVYADLLSAKGFDLGTINSELNRLEEELNKLKD